MTRRNNRKLMLAVVLIMAIAILINAVRLASAQPQPLPEPTTSEQCMYPVRPLVDGQCDNTDPACPETIKIDGGNCNKPAVPTVTPTPIEEPIAAEESVVGK